MSHAQSDFKTDVRHDVHLPSQDHISAARDQVFDYGQNSGVLAKTFAANHEGSVDRDGSGKVAALNFDHDSLYGDRTASGATAKGGRSRAAEDDEDRSGSRGKSDDAPRDNRRFGTKMAGGTDEPGQPQADTMSAAAGQQPKGSVSDFGNGRKEYSERLPDNWGSMSELERQAWRSQFQQRSNEALGIRNEPRLGVDPETGVWTGYAGEEPTEAERKRMQEIENDPRRPHAV